MLAMRHLATAFLVIVGAGSYPAAAARTTPLARGRLLPGAPAGKGFNSFSVHDTDRMRDRAAHMSAIEAKVQGRKQQPAMPTVNIFDPLGLEGPGRKLLQNINDVMRDYKLQRAAGQERSDVRQQVEQIAAQLGASGSHRDEDTEASLRNLLQRGNFRDTVADIEKLKDAAATSSIIAAAVRGDKEVKAAIRITGPRTGMAWKEVTSQPEDTPDG